MATWYDKYAAITLSAAAGLGAYEAVPWSSLNAADWGTWVGAVGTVAALAGTIWLATSEQRRRVRTEKDLALVTAASFTLRIAAVESALQMVKKRMDYDIRCGVPSNYTELARMVRDAGVWQGPDVIPLICLERHVAARLAFVSVEVTALSTSLKQAAERPGLEYKTASAKFNDVSIRRMNSALETLKATFIDCLRFLHASGFNESFKHQDTIVDSATETT